MQALFRSFCLAKIVIFTLMTFLTKRHQKFPLLLPSHNCIIILNVQFSRYNSEFPKKFNEVSSCEGTSFNFLWWRVPGSNRWPPACKAGALPAELTPHRGFLKWWAKMDSNHRPHDYQSCALASWAIGPYWFLTSCSDTHPYGPSKLNNVSTLTLCTDLRTLQATASSYLKSP